MSHASLTERGDALPDAFPSTPKNAFYIYGSITAGLAVPGGATFAARGGTLINSAKASEGIAGSSRFVTNAGGVTEDLVKPGNAISLGHYPEYVDLGSSTGARTFSIPDEAWNSMTPIEQWTRNQRFLDQAIARGSDIKLATRLEQVRPGSSLQREILYLQEKGYIVSSDGASMVKP